MVDITAPSNTLNQTAFIYQKSGYECTCKDALHATESPKKKSSCNCSCSKKSSTKDNDSNNNNSLDTYKDFTITLNQDMLVYLAIGIAVILIIK